MTGSIFDLDRFIADCRDALREHSPQKAVREMAVRALADAPAMMKALGEPKRPGIGKLHESPDLTILNIVWPPGFTIMPHDHRMWAIIGIYSGREDNIFWRRIDDGDAGRIEAAGAHALMQGDCWPLGPDIIHSVTNPIPRFTSAIQIYGGDFFNAPRSQWDPETLREERFDSARTIRLFEAGSAPVRE
jgi:predicted metal-dependent enzyme (double-stranded beta helix superfamily)